MFVVRQLKNAETIERYYVRPRQKILENNQQKNQRTPKKRERPTRPLVPRPNTNPKQLATSLTSKPQFQKSAEQQSDLQKQPSTQMTFLSIP